MVDQIVPFRINISEEAIREPRERLKRTRRPDAETVPDWSQGVPPDLHGGSVPLLGRRLRPAGHRGTAERAAAIPRNHR